MNIDFSKVSLLSNRSLGLVPVIVQHLLTNQVLMLGYMNETAFKQTKSSGKVTFYSRSKQRIWTKGETSGNYLIVDQMSVDCDRDAILIKAKPLGPTCHLGNETCFNELSDKGFLYKLEAIIDQRIEEEDQDSYTNKLYQKGINKVAQKVGEEAVELVIEAKDNNKNLFVNEAADLLYHLLILLKSKDVALEEIENQLKNRHSSKQ